LTSRDLPIAIGIDVCLHHGQIVVARFSGSALMVETFADTLDPEPTQIHVPVHGNTAARVHSHDGVLWLAYRDANDIGHLVRMDNGLSVELGKVYSQRPFAFGRGRLAWLTEARLGYQMFLGDALNHALAVPFSFNVATGLSHITDTGIVVPWENMRLAADFAVGFVRSGPYLVGEAFDNTGLRGSIDGQEGRLILWPDAPMHDPRIVVSGGQCVVVAWASGNRPARLGLVSPADIVTVPSPAPVPPPPTPEPIPVPEIPDQTPIVTAVRARYPTPLGDQHPACLIAIAQAIGHGAGLLRKDAGTHVVLPNGTRVAQDIICFRDGAHYDVLGDAENAAAPGWSFVGSIDPARYVDVSAAPTPTPEPNPTPTPQPGSQLDRIETLLLDLSRHLGARR
jgi:hypothetical protein